jgi:excisionase family DNA binding protein
MAASQHAALSIVAGPESTVRDPALEVPLTVKETAKFLGVSPQTVYLWVERKQIPHLRVMGRNIRFLQIGSRAVSRLISTGDGECLKHKSTTESSTLGTTETFSGFATGIEAESAAGNRLEPRTGRKPIASCGNGSKPETAIC